MASFLFDGGAAGLLDGSIDWLSGPIEARLVRTSEPPLNRNALVMTGIGMSGYDVPLRTKTRLSDPATNRVVYSADAIVFPKVPTGPTVNRVVIFHVVTNDSQSRPIAVVDMDVTTPAGRNIVVHIGAPGLFYSQQ